MKKEYLIAFSSFYKAAYARDILMGERYRAIVVKLPPELIHSCGYGLSIVTTNIQPVLTQLENMEIAHKGVYMADNSAGRLKYKKIG